MTDYKTINEILSNLSSIKSNKDFTRVVNNYTTEGEYEGSYSEYINVYKYKDTDIFIKITTRTDSYGDNESVHSVQFVKPIVKQVTDFETI